ncbi:MAG TPA: HEAT repeat domain-containing protein [Gemmataceae bacterium]|nr:HEAT repeat domain-containing protein [Gemmataceae bacterium]
MRRIGFAVVGLVLLVAARSLAQPFRGPAPNPPPAAPVLITPAAPPITEDEPLLKAAKIGLDGPSLVAFLQQQTTPADRQERIEGLIRRLGDDSYRVREQASADLAKLGAAAVPFLRRALDGGDEEIRERAEALLKDVGQDDSALDTAAARMLRRRAPAASAAALLGRFPDGGNGMAGVEAVAVLAALKSHEGDAAAALLAFVPNADSDAVEDEVIASLAVLGVHDGKVDAGVVQALKDKAPSRRAAAAVVLGRSGTAEQRLAVQALLTDPDPRLRFRAAQGLLAGRDRSAVPALIALLKDARPELARQADELLNCAIGVHAPHVPCADDAQSRQACKKAWTDWAQKNAKTVDLSHAAVDLPPFNGALRARDVVRKCFASIVQGDLPTFQRATDVPFRNFGDKTYQTRQDLDTLFNNNQLLGIRGQPFIPLVIGVVPLQEFAKPNQGAAVTADDIRFLAGFKAGEVIVISVQPLQVGVPPSVDPSQGSLFLVRISGDQPRVVGMNQNRQGIVY